MRKSKKTEQEMPQKHITQVQDLLIALEDNYESMYDVELESGSYELFLKGQTFSEEISTKLVAQREFFEDSAQNIDIVVFPKDRERFKLVVTKEYFKKILEKDTHFDFYYRLLVAGNPVWFKMRVVYKDQTKKNVIVGIFNAEKEVAEMQKEKKLQGDLINRMIGGEGLFLIDLQSDSKRTIHNRLPIVDEYSDEEKYSKSFSRYIENCVAESDREMMRRLEDPKYVAERLSKTKEFSVLYRDITLGFQRFYEVRYAQFSETEVLQSFSEKDKEIIDRLMFAKLKDEYFALFGVDLDTGLMQILKNASEREMGDVGSVSDYKKEMLSIAADFEGDARAFFERISDVSYLKQRFEKEDKATFTYKSHADNGTKWGNVTELVLQRHEDGTPSLLSIGFNMLDSDASERAELQRLKQQTKESQRIIESITAAYNIAYVVNMKDDSFRQLRMDQEIVGSDKVFQNFSQAKEFFFSVLHESDLERMKRELEYSVIREKLAKTKSYNVEYRAVIHGTALWHVMNVTLIYKDEVAISFAERDIALTKQHLADKRYDEYFALFVADIDTGKLKVIKNEQQYRKAKVGETFDYQEILLDMASKLNGDTKAFFTRVSDLEYIKQELAHGDKRTYIYNFQIKGDEKWVELTSYVILRHGDGRPALFTLGFSYADSFAVDRQELQRQVTEQNTLLEKQYDELIAARIAAEEANKSKTNFLFNMSHDIRTPMNAVRGFTTMAKKYVDDKEKVLEYLEKIDISGQQLLSLINQVLEMARIESGKIQIEEKPVSLPEKFSSIVTVLSEQAKASGLELHYFLEDIKHCNVFADEARMSSIILNLVGNAMKYTPEDGRVDFTLKEIHSRKRGYGTFIIKVADTGIGMSKEFQKILFEPFSREKNTTVSKIQGTGLGMSIVKNLIELMGGDIEVDSEVGVGTTFTITLDLRIDAVNDNEDKSEQSVHMASFDGRRVLLVEDNEMNREIARAILEENGFSVDEAVDGNIAVDTIQKCVDRGDAHYYDFILMDIQMPTMNGYEATKAIRAIPELKHTHIPIIAMTANAFEEDRQEAMDAGMDEHIAKPIEYPILLETLSKYL